MQPPVTIIMGSCADLDHCQQIAAALRDLGIDSQMRIGSAHKTPEHLLTILAACESDPRPRVYITVAGRSNALSGFVDAQVTAPVIACPPPSDRFGGADLFSSIRMPGGVAPALVLEPSGAALFAAKILALSNPSIRERIAALQDANRQKIITDDEAAQHGK
ncbi:MAG: AIR carboxylase family protein [Anaerolineae bacterium]|nr:AIR carboxylase family protein [Anaerolineae bacterium]